MQEPAYILNNGQSVPYIPTTIKTNRDAYAASLHVLFKHVADFHICIVKAFSAKYGIPEDDILQTIQESDEFKNMHVDPVLDPLGYLDGPVVLPPTKEEPVSVPAAPVYPLNPNNPNDPNNPNIVSEKSRPPVMKTKSKTNDPIQTPELIKPKIIRKKIVTSMTAPETAPTTAPETAPATAPTTAPETAPTTAPETNAPRKIIKKKAST